MQQKLFDSNKCYAHESLIIKILSQNLHTFHDWSLHIVTKCHNPDWYWIARLCSRFLKQKFGWWLPQRLITAQPPCMKSLAQTSNLCYAIWYATYNVRMLCKCAWTSAIPKNMYHHRSEPVLDQPGPKLRLKQFEL